LKTGKTFTHRLTQTLLAAALALSLTAGLSLLLSHFQALAQPAAEITALLVHKEVNTTIAAPGDVLTYTITIRNSNPPAGTVWLTDTLPAELVCITDSLTSDVWEGSWGVENNVITWTGKMYGNNSTVVITFSARISTSLPYTEIKNTAQVAGSGELIEVSSEKTIVVAEMGNLDNESTRKTVTPPGQAKTNDVLTYTITLGNDEGDPVPRVQVVDRLPSGLNLIAGSIIHTRGSYVVQSDILTWTLDMESGPGTTETLSFNVIISPDLPYAGWITNTALINIPGSSFTRTVGTYVQLRHPQLEAVKSVSARWARPGGYLTYTVRIHNIGDGEAETVWMTDTLPQGVDYVPGSLTATRGSFGEANRVITWNVTLWPAGTLLLPEEEVTITYTVQIPSNLTENVRLVNTAEITGAGTLIQAPASAWAMYRFYLYLPMVLRRWPPIPYAPVLYDIDNPDEGSTYTVRWSHEHAGIPVISYTLQEATNASFTSGLVNYFIDHTGTPMEKAFEKEINGTYYYRVRAHNQYGHGEWSNVESVTVYVVYFDDFSNPGSGWPRRDTLIPPYTDTYYRLHYDYGHYRIMIDQGGPYT